MRENASAFAALFPGQLSEKAGMGEALACEYPYVAELFAAIGERTGVDLPATFFGEGSPSLHDDLAAQVGVFAVSLGALDVLEREYAVVPAAVAGYSLGTYAAFVAAGALERWAALDVLLEAQRLLESDGAPGRMGYVIGLTRQPLEALLAEVSTDRRELTIGTENAAQQFIVTGEAAAVERGIAHAAEVALRAELLPLRFPMHSPLLDPVCERLERFVSAVPVRAPSRGALFAPMLGRRVENAAEAARVLAWQIASPSRFADVLRAAADAGLGRFAEVGPGEILAKLVRWTVRSARPVVLEDPGSIAAFAAAGRLDDARARTDSESA